MVTQNTLNKKPGISERLLVFFFSQGGFWHSRLIEENLVDFFVPFLPLEYKHVILCIVAEMKARKLQVNQALAANIAGDLLYYPKFERIFSVKGCKTIKNRLNFYI